MTTGWGPQATGGVTAVRTQRGGLYWPIYAVISFIMVIPLLVAGGDLTLPYLVVTSIVGVVLGYVDGKKGRAMAHGRTISMVAVAIANTVSFGAYAIGYGVGKSSGKGTKKQAGTSPSSWNQILNAENPHRALQVVAAQPHGKPGGHAGWLDNGNLVTANPRGGVLVIGPPGSGKSAAFIIPSVVLAPGACVSGSIKGDVMEATASVRSTVGRVWHFDPGGAEETMPGVIQARWSPLVGIQSWEDARTVATRMAEPSMKKGDGGDDSNHFVEKGRDWIEVLLYAAHLGGLPISTVADWAQVPDSEDVEIAVNELLMEAESAGDEGARIALGQHRGLLTIPDRERGSIKSSMTKIMRIYGSVVARRIGDAPNFDPRAFVRSSDTLYITASPERQKEYAPLLAGLLEQIRFSTYERHAAEEKGREPKRPHVTFVLDEANNTAPIPLPAIISEAGGQSLHVVVGIQDLSRARARWGKEADGFLTLFPTKIVLNGVIEPYTLDALSNAAGEYDRVMMGYTESTTFVGAYNIPVRQQSPNYSVQRQKVLHQGDISKLPPGKALLFIGAEWWLVNARMHWKDHLWQRVLSSWPTEYYRANPHAMPSTEAPALTAPLKTLDATIITENGDPA